MATIVVIFESRFGQSAKIAAHIADQAHRHGHSARLVRASRATEASLDEADAYVIVAPVYFAHHAREIERLLQTHADTLGARPSAFVSVSNSAASASATTRANATRLAHRLVDQVALRPHVVVTTGGAVAYPRYGFFLRLMMRLIARSLGQPRDTSRVHELTDWPALDAALAPFFQARKQDEPSWSAPSFGASMGLHQ